MSILALSQQVFQELILLTLFAIGLLVAWLVGFMYGREKKRDFEQHSFQFDPAQRLLPPIESRPPAVGRKKKTASVITVASEPVSEPTNKTPAVAREVELHDKPSSRWQTASQHLLRLIGWMLIFGVLGTGGWYGYQYYQFQHNVHPGKILSDSVSVTAEAIPVASSPTSNPQIPHPDPATPSAPDVSPPSTPSSPPAVVDSQRPANSALVVQTVPGPGYQNLVFGFSVTYPAGNWETLPDRPEWGISETSQTPLVLRFDIKDQPSSSMISYIQLELDQNSTHQTLDQWLKSSYRPAILETQTGITINGVPAIQLTATDSKTNIKKVLTILVPNQASGPVYTFTATGTIDGSASEFFQEAQTLVGSFKLL